MAKLKVVVVGAGIGGLTAAIALRHFGIEASIYERASELNGLGAVVAIAPNGSRILADWALPSKCPLWQEQCRGTPTAGATAIASMTAVRDWYRMTRTEPGRSIAGSFRRFCLRRCPLMQSISVASARARSIPQTV